MKKSLKVLKTIYEKNFLKYGYDYKTVGWNKNSALKRHEVMTELFLKDKKKKTILDFGCGLSHYFLYLKKNKIKNYTYIGLDISEKMIEKSKSLYPNNLYICADILEDKTKLPKFDYAVLNGLFTQKLNYSDKVMLVFLKNVTKKIFNLSHKGIAFNLLAPFPDWKNKKNFYPSLDVILKFITLNLSKNIVINHNYKLFEYTIYVYK
jgi:SAM-dependent methyltransferase